MGKLFSPFPHSLFCLRNFFPKSIPNGTVLQPNVNKTNMAANVQFSAVYIYLIVLYQTCRRFIAAGWNGKWKNKRC